MGGSEKGVTEYRWDNRTARVFKISIGLWVITRTYIAGITYENSLK